MKPGAGKVVILDRIIGSIVGLGAVTANKNIPYIIFQCHAHHFPASFLLQIEDGTKKGVVLPSCSHQHGS